MNYITPSDRARLRSSRINVALSWLACVALIFLGAPFWAPFWVGVIGSYFTLRDFRTIRALARKANSHPDPAVQALIDGEIDISDYRKMQEKESTV